MKAGHISWIALFILVVGMGCTSGDQLRAGNELPADTTPGKILIVYLSRTNNTKAVAEMIQAQMGGKLVALELANPYPADYRTTVDQVARENASGFLPSLLTKIDSIDRYDLIFLGFPTWGMQLPPPIKSFLAQYDLTGKTIAPFNTNAGYGIGTTFEQVRALAPKSVVLDGFSTRGGIERDGVFFVMKENKEIQVRGEVTAWLERLEVK